MPATARRSAMTREEFLSWVEDQDGRYEFDGFEPVAMTGGTNNHGIISGNIYFALRRRLGGSGPCRPLTAESGGIATLGGKVRYPDVSVTCSPVSGTGRLIPDPVVVFEVVSAAIGRTDRVDKPIEYRALASMMHYVVVKQASRAMSAFHRNADGTWRPDPLDVCGTLELAAIGVAFPVAEAYEGVLLDGT